ERDNHRRLVGPNGFSPDQALGREGKNPAGDRGIGMVALDRFPADAQPVARGCTGLGGPVQCDESPDGRRLILQRADPPGRVDPSQIGTALETMGKSQEVERMLSVVWAELTPGIVQAIVPPRIQPAPWGTVRRSKLGEAPRLEAESSARSAFRTAHGVSFAG